jgi:tetratricopeptide (TPR) repeat protein
MIQDRGLYLVAILMIAYQAYRGHPTVALLLGIATLAWPAFRIWMALPGIYFARLNKAKDWHRWQEALDLVEKLRRLRKNHFVKLPETELVRSRAQALAGLGRLPEALSEFQQAEGKPGMPAWLYHAHLAGIYDIVKQHDRALEYSVKALQETPTPALYLDLANRLLRFKKDPLQGRQALLEAEKSTLTDIAKPYHLRCRGILAYLLQDYPTAKRELEASLEIMERTRDQPFRDGNISVVKGYLSCVLARLGETPAARKCFAPAKEYLVATGETELLEECKRATGL